MFVDSYFRDDFDRLKEGFIIQVQDGCIGVYFSMSDKGLLGQELLKGELLMELNDPTIFKSNFKTLTATSCDCGGTAVGGFGLRGIVLSCDWKSLYFLCRISVFLLNCETVLFCLI